MHAMKIIFAIAITSVSFSIVAGQIEKDKKIESNDLNSAIDLIAKDQYNRNRLDQLLASAKSIKDVNRLINNSDPRLAPLSRLTNKDRKQFLDSLKFNEKGLTDFDYTPLTRMSASDIYLVMSVFGLQRSAHAIPSARNQSEADSILSEPAPLISDGFLLEYRCEAPGTCADSVRRACTSNC